MCDLAAADRPDLRSLHRHNGRGLTVERDELYLVAAIPMQKYDGADVAVLEPMLGEVDRQNDPPFGSAPSGVSRLSQHGYGTRMAQPIRIAVDIPETLAGQPSAALAARVRLLLIIDEIRAERMTRAAGARALGMTLDAFLIAAGEHGLYAIDYDLDDFKQELDAIGRGT